MTKTLVILLTLATAAGASPVLAQTTATTTTTTTTGKDEAVVEPEAVGKRAAARSHDAPDTGAYISVNVGATFVSKTRLDLSAPGGTFGGTGAIDTLATKVGAKTAIDLRGAVGYDFGTLRTDVEVDFSRSRITSLEVAGNRVTFDGPRVRQLSATANLWVDIPAGRTVTPYLGGGLGFGGVELDGEGKTRFAWQVGAGVGFRLSRSVALTADYRYRSISGGTYGDPANPSTVLRVGAVSSHSASAGLRFTF